MNRKPTTARSDHSDFSDDESQCSFCDKTALLTLPFTDFEQIFTDCSRTTGKDTRVYNVVQQVRAALVARSNKYEEENGISEPFITLIPDRPTMISNRPTPSLSQSSRPLAAPPSHMAVPPRGLPTTLGTSTTRSALKGQQHGRLEGQQNSAEVFFIDPPQSVETGRSVYGPRSAGMPAPPTMTSNRPTPSLSQSSRPLAVPPSHMAVPPRGPPTTLGPSTTRSALKDQPHILEVIYLDSPQSVKPSQPGAGAPSRIELNEIMREVRQLSQDFSRFTSQGQPVHSNWAA
jgi:hypothetical protein